MISYLCDNKGNEYSSQCDFNNAKCDDSTLEIENEGRCQGISVHSFGFTLTKIIECEEVLDEKILS